MTFDKSVTKTIEINAPTSKIWHVLTTAELVRKWLSETDVQVYSEWKIGSPITFVGIWNGVEHQDKGTILQFEPEKVYQYSILSGISGFADLPENYSAIEFRLTPEPTHVLLTVNHSNLITEINYKHANFYWNATVYKIKLMVEQP